MSFDPYEIQADDFDTFEPTEADWLDAEPDQCERCGEDLPFYTRSNVCDRCDFMEYMAEMHQIG